ncbi:MAG TPA: type IV secretion system DNA-binding domain-containing protein, partial [Verrucomicrobiae bacterium]|nr:type IV secretion system DNA-binding domain-containing protein [Verrucomicrobiae bacterium]
MEIIQNPTIIFLILILVAIFGIIGALGYFLIVDLLRKKSWAPRMVDSVFLEVSVPKETSNEQEPQREEKDLISIAEQFFSTIVHEGEGMHHMLGIDEYLSFEILATGKKISFYINTPKKLHSLIEKQLHAQYPKAHIDVVRPAKIFTKGSKYSAAELTLQKDHVFPIRTYKSMESDPLNSLTNGLSKLQPEEGAGIQLVITPAGHGWQQRPRNLALEIQQGRNPNIVATTYSQKAFHKGLGLAGMLIHEVMTPKKKPQEQLKYDPSGMHKPIQLTPMQQEIVKKFEEKASRPGFYFNLRVVTSAKDQIVADSNLKNILASFMQYTMPPFNGFKIKKRKPNSVILDFVFRVFRNSKSVLNTEELVSLWHPPTKYTETPNIKWLQAKKAPAPANIPEEGLLLGKSVYRNTETPIYMKRDDRRRHAYIIGRTGTGKTELMKNMAIQDIRNGEGICIVDPHGDFVEDVLQYIPKERAEDVIVFEPFDTERPLGLNMLEVKDASQKDFVIQEMISIFYKLFPPEMIGPMFEHNMRNVMLTLMEDKEYPGTIAEIPRMFTDTDFQKYK